MKKQSKNIKKQTAAGIQISTQNFHKPKYIDYYAHNLSCSGWFSRCHSGGILSSPCGCQ
jgi:hypothetical protein